MLAFMISKDLEKDFGKLEWNFMLKCLVFFKFSPYIKYWVKIIYTDIKKFNNKWWLAYRILQFRKRGTASMPFIAIFIHFVCWHSSIANKKQQWNNWNTDRQQR